MYFDGAFNQHGYGVGVLFIAPDGVHISLSVKLDFVATNNVAEYEACIVGLKALLAINVKEIPEGIFIQPIEIERREVPAHEREVYVLDDEINDGKPWYYDICNFVEDETYPEGADRKDRKALREEAERLIKEVHQGVCGPHMNGRMLAKKIIHSNLNHLPLRELYNMTLPWPFSIWGIDIIGKITPKSSNEHEFILVAIDYFTKWVEAASFSVLKAKHVRTLHKYSVKHHKSSPYRPQTNGAMKSANKNVKVILEKTIERYQDWEDKLPFALWGYRTSIRTSIGMTPYSLVYGLEAVLPAEMEAKYLRKILESQIPEVEWVKARYEELVLTDEKRLKALYHVQRISRKNGLCFQQESKA
uniref:Uncharacterized protein n=1 Tax=Fagus sylvatica TaxID=28930 RepID=A0A2N9FWV5_FAGSY